MIARLKVHLFKRHESRFSCGRCFADLNNAPSLERHQRASIACTPKLQPDFRMFTGHKAIELKKKSDLKKNEEGKWIDLYSILFPDVPASDIPSPHHGEMSNPPFYSPQQLSDMIRDKLHASMIPADYHDSVIEVMRTCVEELLRQGKPAPNFPQALRERSLLETFDGPTGDTMFTKDGREVPLGDMQPSTRMESSEYRTSTTSWRPSKETNLPHQPWIAYENGQIDSFNSSAQQKLVNKRVHIYQSNPDWSPQQGAPSNAALDAWRSADFEERPTAPQSFTNPCVTNQNIDPSLQGYLDDTSGPRGFEQPQYWQDYNQ